MGEAFCVDLQQTHKREVKMEVVENLETEKLRNRKWKKKMTMIE